MKNTLALNWILAHHWAMLPENLVMMLSIAERNHDQFAGLVDVAAKQDEGERKIQSMLTNGARPLSDAPGVLARDGVGIISVVGPIFRYANLFGSISAATSLDILTANYEAVKQSNKLDALVCDFNSPGGELAGIHQFASDIHKLTATKTVGAYGSGLVCSAAYGLAAPASVIWASPDATIGSIGVIGARPSKDGYEIVSSQSPYKRLDPNKKDHMRRAQKGVDDAANLFIKTIAQHRGTSRDHVLRNYGQGGVMIASQALKAGMIDGTGSLDDFINHIANLHASQFVPSRQSLTPATKPAKTSASRAPSTSPVGSKSNMRLPNPFARQQANFSAGYDNFAAQLGATPVGAPAQAEDGLPAAGHVLMPDGRQVALSTLYQSAVDNSQIYAQPMVGQIGQIAQPGDLSATERVELENLRGQVRQNSAQQAQTNTATAVQLGQNIANQLLTAGHIEPSATAAVASFFGKMAYMPHIIAAAGIDEQFGVVQFATYGANGVPQTGSASLLEFAQAMFEARPTVALTQDLMQSPARASALFNRPNQANGGGASLPLPNGTFMNGSGAAPAPSAQPLDRISAAISRTTGKSQAVVAEAMNRSGGMN